MRNEIKSKYDEEINAYIVTFPKHVTYDSLRKWKIEFHEILDARSSRRPEALLLDSNKHDFESIDCLRFLREIITQLANMESGICKIAFVQPSHFRNPEVIDEKEAHFSNIEKAKSWLRG